MKRQKLCEAVSDDDIFKKQYKFEGNEKWKVPSENEIFQANKWQICSLQHRKHELNAVKEKLSEFDLDAWSLHTKKRDPSNQILKHIRHTCNTELLTQAWCKFYECISHMSPLVPDYNANCIFRTLHLCEAPGGFISALNHYCALRFPRLKLCWHATSLNPYYEGNSIGSMIPDDRLIQLTKENWSFGADHSGDVLKLYNYKFLVALHSESGRKLNLITADGSVNCMSDPSNQERLVEHLHYCEVVTALTLLEKGGKFVLKIFTIFEDSTVSLLYLLNCAFQSVTVMKPATSKSGNSETYVLCDHFNGYDSIAPLMPKLIENYETHNKHKSLLPLDAISGEFLEQIEKCTEFFMRLQIATITRNIQTFAMNEVASQHCASKVYKKNAKIARKFMELYKISSLPARNRLVKDTEITFTKATNNRLSKMFYKYYVHDPDKEFSVNVVIGRRLNEVLFSKFVHHDNMKLHSNYVQLHRLKRENFGKFDDNSLFHLCKQKIAKILPKTEILDYSKDLHREQSEIHEIFFLAFSDLLRNKQNVLIINLSLLTNFLVGLLYILSLHYCVHFFRGGILYLSLKNSCEKYDLVREMFKDIRCARLELGNLEFSADLLELIKFSTFDSNFLKCVLFYNDNFC